MAMVPPDAGNIAMRTPAAIATAFLSACVVLPTAAQARSCTQRYNRCVSVCMTSGIGPSRGGGITRPMSADVCHAHCGDWAKDCRQTGCFNGDLRKECGLVKR